MCIPPYRHSRGMSDCEVLTGRSLGRFTSGSSVRGAIYPPAPSALRLLRQQPGTSCRSPAVKMSALGARRERPSKQRCGRHTGTALPEPVMPGLSLARATPALPGMAFGDAFPAQSPIPAHLPLCVDKPCCASRQTCFREQFRIAMTGSQSSRSDCPSWRASRAHTRQAPGGRAWARAGAARRLEAPRRGGGPRRGRKPARLVRLGALRSGAEGLRNA